MQRDFVKEIFGQNGEDLIAWVKAADFDESSPTSDYETYGQWMVMKNPNQVVFAKWNNVSAKLESDNASYAEIVDGYSKYGSVSNHSYL
jgi:hypothetical protein